MKDVEKYRIVRGFGGDSYERLWKGYHIGASMGGMGLSYNFGGADVPTQWKALSETRHRKIIAQIKNCPEVDIVLNASYHRKLDYLILVSKKREEARAKLKIAEEALKSATFVNRIFWKVRLGHAQKILNRFSMVPEPRDWTESFPKYSVDHKTVYGQ